jgi:hypothetical protein
MGWLMINGGFLCLQRARNEGALDAGRGGSYCIVRLYRYWVYHCVFHMHVLEYLWLGWARSSFEFVCSVPLALG